MPTEKLVDMAKAGRLGITKATRNPLFREYVLPGGTTILGIAASVGGQPGLSDVGLGPPSFEKYGFVLRAKVCGAGAPM
jgi:hypothetical protein